jgi:hypothetical protein
LTLAFVKQVTFLKNSPKSKILTTATLYLTSRISAQWQGFQSSDNAQPGRMFAKRGRKKSEADYDFSEEFQEDRCWRSNIERGGTEHSDFGSGAGAGGRCDSLRYRDRFVGGNDT